MIKHEISAFRRADFHLFDALKEQEILLLSAGLPSSECPLAVEVPGPSGGRSTWTRLRLRPALLLLLDLRCFQVFHSS